jgi:hypothetical protein
MSRERDPEKSGFTIENAEWKRMELFIRKFLGSAIPHLVLAPWLCTIYNSYDP